MYQVKSNLEVHLFEPGQLHFVQVHFTADKVRPGSAKIFFSGTVMRTVSCCETTRTRLTVLWCLARLARPRASGVTMDPASRLSLLTSSLSLGVPVQRTT